MSGERTALREKFKKNAEEFRLQLPKTKFATTKINLKFRYFKLQFESFLENFEVDYVFKRNKKGMQNTPSGIQLYLKIHKLTIKN